MRRVSGRATATSTRAVAEVVAAATPGSQCATLTSTAASAGPQMKPRPNAAPMMPMPLVRSRSSVMSAITAWAVEMLPPEIPSMIRAAKSMASEPANANSR